jgi:hypothetical protein
MSSILKSVLLLSYFIISWLTHFYSYPRLGLLHNLHQVEKYEPKVVQLWILAGTLNMLLLFFRWKNKYGKTDS